MSKTHHHALITALCCLSGLILSSKLHFNDAFWLLITIFVIMADATMHPWFKGSLRLMGTIIGAVFGFIALFFVINDKVLMSVVLFSVIVIICYHGFHTHHFYGYIFASITFFLCFAASALEPRIASDFVSWRVIDVTIGVILCSLFTFFLPHYQHKKKTLVTSHALAHSIKIALSAFLSFYICVLIGWFGAISGIISAFLISMESSFKKAHLKAAKRFSGCLLGGSIGLTVLVLAHDNFYVYSVCFFGTIYLLAYKKLSSKNYSYMYFQAGLAFFLAVITPLDEKGNDIFPALERLAGIFLGSGIAVVVNYLIMPSVHQEKLAPPSPGQN